MHLQVEPASFPQAPPRCLDDPTVIAEHDWAAFGEVKEMTNHWDRPGWSTSTRAYYWMITFPRACALIKRARQCQQALSHLGLDDIDEDGLHLTLGRIGSTTEINPGQLDSLFTVVQEAKRAPFSLSVAPLTASRGAIRFSVAPWTPLVELHATLADAGVKTGVPLRRATSGFRPHIGISYCNRPVPAATVRDALRPLRDLDTVEVAVTQVHIVELRREQHAYRWQDIHTLDLH